MVGLQIPVGTPVNFQFQLPLNGAKLLSPTIMNGQIIEVQYTLQVSVVVSGCRSNIDFLFPVVIGSVNGTAPQYPVANTAFIG